MAKGFSPLIGLAVVVALAFAAVFGAMSLTPNPAEAQAALMIEATTGDASITVTWEVPDDIPGTASWEVWYRDKEAGGPYIQNSASRLDSAAVDIGADDSMASADIAASGDVPATLTNGAVYEVRVAAFSAATAGTRLRLSNTVEVTPNETPTGTLSLTPKSVKGGVELSYGLDTGQTNDGGAITSWQYQMREAADLGANGIVGGGGVDADTEVVAWDATGDAAIPWMDIPGGADTSPYTVPLSDDLKVGGIYHFRVRAMSGNTPGTPADTTDITDLTSQTMGVSPMLGQVIAIDSTIDVSGVPDPGKVDRIELKFDLEEKTNTLVHDMVIDLEDFVFPSTVGTSSVVVKATGFSGTNVSETYTFTPEDVDVDGTDLVLSLGDVTEDTSGGSQTGGIYEIPAGSDITVVIRSTADIATPTEAGGYAVKVTFGDNEVVFAEVMINRVVVLADADSGDEGLTAGRGDMATVAGKGYKNGTTVTFWRDSLSPVMWDHDSITTTAMVRLEKSDLMKYEMDTMDDYRRSSLSYRIGNDVFLSMLPQFENLQKWDHDDNSSTDSVDTILAPNGVRDPDEEILCSDVADGNHVATCDFEVNNPPFIGGDRSNYLNGVDGRGQRAAEVGHYKQRLLLVASIDATPSGGSPGEVMLVQLLDFPSGESVDRIQLSRTDICGGSATNADGTTKVCTGSTDSQGNVNVSVVIPNWAVPGKQELKVFTSSGDDNLTVDITGPRIQATPKEVVANQRVSLVGSGFFAGSKIGNCGSCGDAAITIGGDQIPWPQINGNDDVDVDNGGNWSAAVDLPLTSATTADGRRTIRVTDSMGRTGTVDVTILARRVEITPASGRVGTESVVRGWNFPSKNDDGESFNIVIRYDAGNQKGATVTAVPDASGRFETPLRIPTTAGIPSTNTVTVEFNDVRDVTVVTTVTHDVPEGIINLSSTSGSPGSKITISGEGFKTHVPVQSVKVGPIEVTPSPNPSTDGQGMMSFEVTIPGLDNGIQTIEVKVSGTTASVGFTVRPSGVSAGDITASAEAIANLGENFVRSFNFNNDTKSWTFYSPEAPDDSTQANFITRESYWILIEESQEVILNGKTRNLTCASGSCWNQIVW